MCDFGFFSRLSLMKKFFQSAPCSAIFCPRCGDADFLGLLADAAREVGIFLTKFWKKSSKNPGNPPSAWQIFDSRGVKIGVNA
ncbi:MAG: hypothetical protein PUD41_07840 [bacterium]|nr:hypothetical protein [bacterium]